MTREFHRGLGVADFAAFEALAVAVVQAARGAKTIMDVLNFSANVTGLKGTC